jgi:hypothetical protein
VIPSDAREEAYAATESCGRLTITTTSRSTSSSTRSYAEAFRSSLRELWRRVEAEGLIESPRARIVETAESKEY